jgi:shikimate dehydrogenase
MGAGGACVALAAHLLERPRGERPAAVALTDIDPERLADARRHLEALDRDGLVGYRRVAGAEDHDALLAALPAASLVVNGTGLGKDRPGSPITDAAVFPEGGIAWEFNYRGELGFLHRARRQTEARRLRVADGWVYFLYGWAHVIAEVFDRPLDDTLFARLERAAERLR